MTSRFRTMLTFSVSSYILLTQLEQEFTCHRDVSAGISYDGEAFILVIECDDSAVTAWDVRMLVQTFDPDSTLCRQTTQLTSGMPDQPAA